ncbi:hypothetical protein LTR85_009574 [Meristemomyces frigidus]|nr:hypothetical protein LTR85_009574 [Meristemomyces frigidus]
MATVRSPASADIPAEYHNDASSDQNTMLGWWERMTQEVSTRLAALRVPADSDSQSPLLKLPTELRFAIYDELFDPLIVQPPEHLDTFVLPSEWPKIELGTYTSLLLTCHQLRSEAKAYFEKLYLPRLTLYFDNVLDMGHFTKCVAGAPKYQDIHVYLHNCGLSAWFFHNDGDKAVLDSLVGVAGDVGSFIRDRVKASFGWNTSMVTDIKYNSSMMPLARHSLVRQLRLSNLRMPLQLSFCSRQGKKVEVLPIPMLSSPLRTSIHQLGDHPETTYVVMTGRARDLLLQRSPTDLAHANLDRLVCKRYRDSIQGEDFAQAESARFDSF